MPNRKERRLLALLTATAVLAAVAVSVSLGMERMQAARSQTEKLRAGVAGLEKALPSEAGTASRSEGLEADLAALKSRFYAAGDMNPYSFGTLVKDRLTALGMSVVRYQVVDVQDRKGLEFSVTGPVRSLVLFLRGVSDAPKYSSIPSLTVTVREGTDVVDAVFRIGYETLD
jgi:hypothetical protein